jgi:Matrixin
VYVRQVNGDVIVALSDTVFKSCAYGSGSAGKILVAIRRFEFGAANEAANVIAHEFGHVIGLRHNKDAMSLMCGPGVPRCDSTFPIEGNLPLTNDEKRKPIEMYPPDWGPSHPPGKGDPPPSLTTG